MSTIFKQLFAFVFCAVPVAGMAQEADVYVVGCSDFPDGYRGFIYKNDEPQLLEDLNYGGLGNSESIPNAICVSGNDVYIAGWKNSMLGSMEGREEIAFLMKNEDILMWGNCSMSYGHSVALDGDDVYLAFTEADKPYVWHNGEIIRMPTERTEYFSQMSIAAFGGEVFVSGATRNKSYIWKNTEVVYRDIPGEVVSLTATSKGLYGIVFVNGSYNINLWHDGELRETGLEFDPYILSGQDFRLMAVSGDNVYIVGLKDKVPSIWKNGEVSPMTQSDNTYNPVGISVCGKDVYVLSYKYLNEPEDGTYNPIVIYKNGEALKLPTPIYFPAYYMHPIAIQAVSKGTDGIESVVQEPLAVTIDAGEVWIKNLKPGQPARLYSVDGTLVGSSLADKNGTARIPLKGRKGAVIIHSQGKTKKVLL